MGAEDLFGKLQDLHVERAVYWSDYREAIEQSDVDARETAWEHIGEATERIVAIREAIDAPSEADAVDALRQRAAQRTSAKETE